MNQRPEAVPDGQFPSGPDTEDAPLFTPRLPPVPELDQSIIDDLFEIGGAELVGELATMSCAAIIRSTADLDLALSQANAGAVARSAHALAGVSAGIGATRLAAVAGTLERLAVGGELASARALRVELSERSVLVRHALGLYTTEAREVADDDAGPVVGAVDGPPHVSFLLVDDVPATRRFVRAALETVTSFEVVGEAGTGQQAIELAASLQPNLVLLDLELGDTDAVDILPDLIRVAPATRVAILSRHSIAEGPAISGAGLIGYITKGLQASELVDKIGALIGGPLVVKPRTTPAAIALRPDLCRAVVFDPDPLTRRTINWVLAESKVQIISEVNATDNVADVLSSAVKLLRPGLVVLGGTSHAYGARLILALRRLAPDGVFINYASDVPPELTGEGSWLHVVVRGDVERLRSCVCDVMAGQNVRDVMAAQK